MQNEKTDNKTLAVAAVYDRDGIIDDYLIFYLSSLREVADRLIVAVNGKLTGAGREKLMVVATKYVEAMAELVLDWRFPRQ